MAISAHDVQVWLCKILKSSSRTCFNISRNRPFPSISLVCLFLLYISSPSYFWILIYSFSIVLFLAIIIRVSLDLYRKSSKFQEENDINSCTKIRFRKNDDASDRDTKSFRRVHSVRRRRAKNIMWEENTNTNTPQNIEDKSTIFSTSFNNDNKMIDKKALKEESEKEIREVEIDSSSSLVHSSSSWASHGFSEGSQGQSLEGSEEEEEGGNKTAVEWTENDQKNVMDVGISEIERNKRLESLIARRRARKLLGLQVRRTLMNMDRNIRPSVEIPRHVNIFSANYNGGQISPAPGSAPSVLIPMRNPFDIPYDPQEERPDLTGDVFNQELTSGPPKDTMFCRHESFRLGSFDVNPETEQVHDGMGFRQRGSSHHGYQFSKLGNKFDKEFSSVLESEAPQAPEPSSILDNENDHIKEVIQVSETAVHNHDPEEKESIPEIHKEQMPEEDISRRSSPSSSSEDEPCFKIDKEAILKSLSSPARRHETEDYDKIEDHPNHLRSHHPYYIEKPMKHHTPSYSIASDMQVEVSEIGSPPLTIDENLSLHDEEINEEGMEKVVSIGSHIDVYGDSSNFFEMDIENELRSREETEVTKHDIMEIGFSRPVNTKERPLAMEEYSMHSRFSLAPLDEFQETGSARSTFLDEKIEEVLLTPVGSGRSKLHKTLVFPVEETADTSTRSTATYPPQDIDSRKKDDEDDKTDQITEQLEIAESNTDEHKTEHTSPNGCDQTNHSMDGNIISSENDEERLRFLPHEEITPAVMNHENPQHINEDEQSSATVRIDSTASDSSQTLNLAIDERVPVFESSSTSPKSVLHQTFSLASFDQYVDGEGSNSGARTAEALSPVGLPSPPTSTEEQTIPSTSSGNTETSQESSEPPSTFTEEVEVIETVNGIKTHENEITPEETAIRCSTMMRSHEPAAEPILNAKEETISNMTSAPVDIVDSTKLTDENNLNSYVSIIEQESDQHPHAAAVDDVTQSDIFRSGDEQRDNSTLHEDNGLVQHLDDAHSTSSNMNDNEIENSNTDGAMFRAISEDQTHY